MAEFSKYGDVIFDAFRLHTKKKEIVERKQDIIDKIVEFYNTSVESILFVGFSPAILSCRHKNIEIYIAEVSDDVVQWLKSEGITLKTFDSAVDKKFDLVIAFDEYLTFAASDDEQRAAISSLCKYSANLIITTVKDYKNQDFKDREYSQPAIIKNGDQLTAFTEIHDWDQKDKNIWTTALYQLSGEVAQCRGIYNRRTLFFKQLAKLSMDVGATNFLVHKNLMYKSLIKKNYEHVISISFEN
jgi:hypothetical protein